VAKKYPLQLFGIFWTTDLNFDAKFHTLITCSYSLKSAKRHFIMFILHHFMSASMLLDFSCNHIVISLVTWSRMCTELKAHDTCTSEKTLSFKLHNKQFANDCEKLKCPPAAFTHAFNLLVQFLTALLMASCPRSPAVRAWDNWHTFSFGEKIVNKYENKLKEKTLQTFCKVYITLCHMQQDGPNCFRCAWLITALQVFQREKSWCLTKKFCNFCNSKRISDAAWPMYACMNRW